MHAATAGIRPPLTSHVARVMGTVVSFDLRGDGDHRVAVMDAVEWLTGADARFSTYRPDSEVSRFARGELSEDALSADLHEVIAACARIEATSGGAFSAVRAHGFDPSGYVKGWSVERAGEILRAHGCWDWTINAGGDVLVSSSSPAAPAWRIGIRHPFDPGRLATVVRARNLAVATSGRYERGDHIDDPRTGLPAASVMSTTVCGPDLGLADAYATAAFVLGADGPAWVAALHGYECWTVLDERRVLATAGFPRLVHGVQVSRSPRADVSLVSA